MPTYLILLILAGVFFVFWLVLLFLQKKTGARKGTERMAAQLEKLEGAEAVETEEPQSKTEVEVTEGEEKEKEREREREVEKEEGQEQDEAEGVSEVPPEREYKG